MVAVADQQERFAGKLPAQPIEQFRIGAKAHALPPQIFVDVGRIARRFPIRRQLGPPAVVPGVMVGGEIDEEKHRPLLALALDHAHRGVVVETIGLDTVGAERVLVEKSLNAGGGLKIPGAHEGAKRGVDGEGAIPATMQRRRQAALHPPGGDLRHVVGEAPERARGEAGKHVVLGVPARTARAFADEVPALAIEGTEVIAVIGANLDAGQGADVKTRLVVHENDVGRPSARHADLVRQRAQAISHGGSGVHISARR